MSPTPVQNDILPRQETGRITIAVLRRGGRIVSEVVGAIAFLSPRSGFSPLLPARCGCFGGSRGGWCVPACFLLSASLVWIGSTVFCLVSEIETTLTLIMLQSSFVLVLKELSLSLSPGRGLRWRRCSNQNVELR